MRNRKLYLVLTAACVLTLGLSACGGGSGSDSGSSSGEKTSGKSEESADAPEKETDEGAEETEEEEVLESSSSFAYTLAGKELQSVADLERFVDLETGVFDFARLADGLGYSDAIENENGFLLGENSKRYKDHTVEVVFTDQQPEQDIFGEMLSPYASVEFRVKGSDGSTVTYTVHQEDVSGASYIVNEGTGSVSYEMVIAAEYGMENLRNSMNDPFEGILEKDAQGVYQLPESEGTENVDEVEEEEGETTEVIEDSEADAATAEEEASGEDGE